ncbi:MAG: hypothetical protein ACI8QZ_003908 [Chlamydiales bacterium]|jgi:hypothetical protein
MLDAMSRARPARPTRAAALDAGGSRHRPACRPYVALALAAWLALAACAPQRILTVESYPPGAVVRLDERVIGRTPLDYPFDHYGQRRITLYLPGYRTWSRRLELSPPWHARFPIDIVTELLIPIGLRDQHEVWVVLENDEVVGGHPDLGPLLERAREMRARGAQIREEEAKATGGASEGETEAPTDDVPEAPPEEQP